MYFVALYKSEKRRFHLPTIIPLNVSSVLQTVWDYKRKVELAVHTVIVLFYSKIIFIYKNNDQSRQSSVNFKLFHSYSLKITMSTLEEQTRKLIKR